MAEDSKIPDFIRGNPKFKCVLEALDAFHAGNEVSSTCPVCGKRLSVIVLEAIDTLWVACPKGCTTYREKYARGALSRGTDDGVDSG